MPKAPHKEQDGLTKHVALVGMTGAGKSTLVNVLLNGSDKPILAPVSNDAEPCTLRYKNYDITRGRVKYSLWDTRGLNEAQENEAMGPISRLLRFLKGVSAADSELREFLRSKNPKIDLILFCIDAKKIQAPAHWKDYGKIYTKFCRKKIKVAVVVTQITNARDRDWRDTCYKMIKEVVGECPDTRLVESVPTFGRLEETRECNEEIWRLISNSFKRPSDVF